MCTRPLKEGSKVSEKECENQKKSPLFTVTSDTSNEFDDVKTSSNARISVFKSLSPQAYATICMSAATSLHFFGYELARSGNLSLFTSSNTGFSSSGAFPLAMACVSPTSVLLILGYTSQLEKYGPRLALRNTTTLCFAMIVLSGLLVSIMQKSGIDNNNQAFTWIVPILKEPISLCKIIVWISFIFQNSYAHLLYTQHWSFLGSILNERQAGTYFATIAGVASLSSTLAGTILSKFVDKIGLAGLLIGASISLLASLLCADKAYSIAEKNGFDPANEIKKKVEKKNKKKSDSQNSMKESGGIVKKAYDLFMRVPVLGALFLEVIAFQSLSTIINVCFITKLKESIVNDALRAAWTGKFYAFTSGSSGLLQFAVLPFLMNRVQPKMVWRFMPVLPMVLVLIINFQEDPSLMLIASCLFFAKSMDYSFRNVVNEMVYVSLDFDSRFLGKEINGVFGNRLGKSGISFLLSGLPYIYGNQFGLYELTRLAVVAASGWFVCAYRLSLIVPCRKAIKDEGKKL